MKIKNNSIWNDLLWYTLGSFIPLIIGVLRTPVFTRYFTPEEYGYFGIITITYTVISIFLFNWLANCIWRFYNYYKKENRLNEFYFNLFFLYTCFSIVFLITSLIWSISSDVTLIRKLTVLVFLQMLINYPINYILIVDRLEYRTQKYNSVQMLRAVCSFIILYLLSFQYNMRIEAIPIATLSIDLIIFAFIFPPFCKNIKVRLAAVSKDIIKNLFTYSSVGIISGLSLIILASSDRYLIAYFGNMKEVGIYNQVYNLSQISITALVGVLFALINPNLNRTLENNFIGSNRLTKHYLFAFFILLLPITVYLSMFANQLSVVLLGKDFRSGYDIIPYVMLSSFFYGLTIFPDNRLKFSSHYLQLIIGIVACSAINILLNIIFLPVYSYKFAAYSTLICYSLLMIFYFYLDIKKNSFSLKGWQVLIPSVIILFVQWITDYLLRTYWGLSIEIWGTIIELIIFTSIYGLVIYYFSSGSIKLLLKNYN